MTTERELVVNVPVAFGLAPPIEQITRRGSGMRKYRLTHLPGKPLVPSSTSVIDGTVRNFGLEKWKLSRIRGELERLDGRTISDGLIENCMTAADRDAKDAAEVGSGLHSLIDDMLQHKDVSVPSYYAAAIEAFERWRSTFSHWTYVSSEVAVYRNGMIGASYAGMVDAVFEDTRSGDLYIVDWKTSRKIYSNAITQVASYAYAMREMLMDSRDDMIQRVMPGKNGNPSGLDVRGMVVRFDNSYATSGSSREKVFNGDVEYSVVDVEKGYSCFSHIYHVLKSSQTRVETVRI